MLQGGLFYNTDSKRLFVDGEETTIENVILMNSLYRKLDKELQQEFLELLKDTKTSMWSPEGFSYLYSLCKVSLSEAEFFVFKRTLVELIVTGYVSISRIIKEEIDFTDMLLIPDTTTCIFLKMLCTYLINIPTDQIHTVKVTIDFLRSGLINSFLITYPELISIMRSLSKFFTYRLLYINKKEGV